MKRIGRQPEHLPCATISFAHPLPEHSSSTDVVVRTQNQPRTEVPRARPYGHVPPYFTEQRQWQSIQPRNLRHIDSEQLVGFGSQIKLRFPVTSLVPLLSAAPVPLAIRRRWLFVEIGARLEPLQ